MCGIAGIIHRDGPSDMGVEITKMLQSMKHRGPDSTGYALYSEPDDLVTIRFMLAEPKGSPRLWFKTEYRAGGVQFSGDGQVVLASEVDRKTRTERVWRHDMNKLGQSGELVYERSMQDV